MSASPLVEHNKSAVRAYAAAFGRGDFEKIQDLCAPDVIVQGVLAWELGLRTAYLRDLHEAYGMRLDIEELIGADEFVAARYSESGVSRKPFRGTPATGKSYCVTAMEWFRFENGKIAERWGARDSAAIQRQLAAD